MRSGLRIDQLGIDADLLAGALDTSFEDITHAEVAADPLGIDRFAFVGKRGVARDHQAALDPRNVGRQILGDPVGEIFLLGVVAAIGERQHDDRQPWSGIRRQRQAGSWCLRLQLRVWSGLPAEPQPPSAARESNEQQGSQYRSQHISPE